MTSGWSIMLPPGWWHVALNQRRRHSVQAMLNRMLADLRYGTLVAASCLATVVETAPPAGTPARYLAVILAGDDGQPAVIEVDGADDTDQRIRDTEQQVRRTREHLDVVLAATVSARMEAYLPFPSEERMLILTFSTPITDLAEPMLGLFQAMTESLRWTQEPS